MAVKQPLQTVQPEGEALHPRDGRRLGAAAGKKKSFPALRKLMLWWGEQRKTMNNRMVYVNRSTRRRKQGKQPRRGRKGLLS